MFIAIWPPMQNLFFQRLGGGKNLKCSTTSARYAAEKQNRGMVHVAINIHPSGVWSHTFRTSPVLRLQTR
jgi:hypothetical protein